MTERVAVMAGRTKVADLLTVRIALVTGVDGPCLVLIDDEDGDGRRIAGPKPWGGGMTTSIFTATLSVVELRKAHRAEAKRTAKAGKPR